MTVLSQPRLLGRYLFYAPIASGGMATVYLGRMAGPKGFSRIVAIKQLHAQYVHDADFVTMFTDEAHLIGRIHHSNVVPPIDVVEADGDLCIIMEYVHGEALGRLMRLSRPERIPLRVVTAIMVQTLLGLHAAHVVADGDGQPLAIVHRDVSPQNILVGEDGIARVVDFGIATAADRAHKTDSGKLKGKLGYMSPEQLLGGSVDARCDIFSSGIILWEMLTGKKLFGPADALEAVERMRTFEPKLPSAIVPTLSPEFDSIALKALALDPSLRFSSAHEMARSLAAACPPAGAIEVAEWVTSLASDTLRTRATWIQDLASIDLGEWTQTHVFSTTLPPIVNNGSFSAQDQSKIPTLPPEPLAVGSTAQNAQGVSLHSLATQLQATERPSTSRHTKWLRLVSVGVFLSVAVVFAGFGLLRRGGASRVSRKLSVFAAKPASSAEVVNGSSGALHSSLIVDAGSSSAIPSGERDAAPPASHQSTLSPSGAATPPHVAPMHSSGTIAKTDCRTPYVIDSKRIKRFRPECFH